MYYLIVDFRNTCVGFKTPDLSDPYQDKGLIPHIMVDKIIPNYTIFDFVRDYGNEMVDKYERDERYNLVNAGKETVKEFLNKHSSFSF